MPLRVVHVRNRARVVVVCDQCGEPIKRAADGNYQWDEDKPEAEITFSHKGCLDAFEQDHPGGWGVNDLESLPVYLVKGLGIDWKDACVRVNVHEAIG